MIEIMTSKILLVEDEAILAMAQAQKLQKNGFDVVLAHKGEQAVDMVATDRDVSLVLMDIDLGRGIDGTEAAQRILGDREIPIVFLTSHSEKEYVDKVKKITGYGYVLKNSGEFVLIESINMAYTLFAAKGEALQHLHDSKLAYRELEVREERLQHVNRVLLSIRHINQIITEETEVTALIDNACKILIETSGYSKAWAVLLHEDSPVEPFYHAGFENAGFTPMVRQLHEGVIPSCAAKAIDEGRVVLTSQPSTECPNCPFGSGQEPDGCSFGEIVSLTAALQYDNVIYGWISAILPAFYSENPDEIGLFEEIARDIAYALHGLAIDKEKRAVQTALQESEEKYRAMYTNAPLPYQSLDAEGRFIDVNPAWLTTLGYTREEVIGEKYSDFLHPDWKPHFETNFPAFKKRGYVHDVQFKIRHKSGEYRDISFEGCIGYKPDGSVRQTYCVFKDITEQKRAEIKLQESKENLRITLNSIGDAVISTDKNGNVIHMNPIAEQLTGWDIDAAKGKMLKDVFHIINADTRKIVNNPAEKVIKSGDIVGLGNHTVLISKNEQEYQIADSAAPIKDDKGNINGVVLVFRDITEEYEIERQLKESEKKYRGLFNSIRDAILVTDTDRNILDCNPAFTDLFGYSLEDIRNKKTESVYQNEEEYVQMGKALREHKGDLSHFLSTVHYKRKDGRTFSGETNVFYLKDSYEKVTGFIGIIRDISERLQAEHMRKEREYRLQRTQEIAHIGNWDLDLKDTTLHWSDEIYRIFGMEPQQFKSTYHAFLERVHPEDREKVDAAYWNSIRDRKDVYEIEHRIVRKDDGTIRYVYEKCEHVKNDSGEILHSLGMVQDITESKKVEDELKKSKDRYKRIVHNSPNLIMETDIDTLEIINCNPAMANNLGYAIQEILGKRIDEFIPSDILKGRIEASQRAIETEESQILEDERRGKFFHTT